ncbi:MAG: phenylalanine--tRNA ligase subunit beta [Candidatus Nanoarchaeia archaeon]
MPSIELSLTDLRKLVGDKLPTTIDELDPIIHNLKGECEALENDTLTINLSDANRPELWCAEGIARELKGIFGIERGVKDYKAEATDFKVFVNSKLKDIRPYIACAVVKDVSLNDTIIRQLMQLQDKIDISYGRNRRKTSIGFYNFDLLKFPLKYTMTKPHENAFVPLDFAEKLNPHEILSKHPKGLMYGNILKGLEEYPIFIDAEGKVLSMPPIINSANLGKVTESTKNLLIEVTGTDYEAVNHVLTIIATALAERGGKLYSVTIEYNYRKPDLTPHLETSVWKISMQQISDLLGIKTLPEDVAKLLQRARYSVTVDSKDVLSVRVPCYRRDIMHFVDIIEDIAIAYGYNNFDLAPIVIPTTGKLSSAEKTSDKIRELCIGLGAQEVMTFTLTNKENLFRKMCTKEENVIEVENPISLTYTCLRNKLLPSLLEFLSHNTKKEFPQMIFEVGDVVHYDSKQAEGSKTEKRLAFVISHAQANFTEAKQNLEAIYRNLGKVVVVKDAEHSSFIAGRCAKIFLDNDDIGIIGEIHPEVLQKWGLEMPTVAFEVTI